MNSKKGFSLIEIVLALAVATIVFISVFHFATTFYMRSKIDNKSQKKYFTYSYGEQYCRATKGLNQVTYDTSQYIDVHSFISTSTRVTSIHILTEKMFLITTDSASTSEHDIFIFNIENNIANRVSSIDVGPGIQDSKLLDKYLYIANTSVNSHSKTLYLDLSASSTFTELSNIKIPSLGASVSLPKKITVYNNRIILGSEKSNSGGEVFVFPIDQDGAIRTATYSQELDGQMNQALVAHGDVLIANAADPELRVFNNAFNSLFTYDAPLTLGNGKSVLFKNPYIILGRTLGSGELSLLHQIGSTTKVLDTERTHGTVDFIQDFGEDLFLTLTANEDEELQFWEIEKNLNSTKLIKSNSINIDGRVTAYACSKDVLYMFAIINNQSALLWLKI